MFSLSFDHRVEFWPYRNPLVISRCSIEGRHVMVVSITDGLHTGRGECTCVLDMGYTVEAVSLGLEALRSLVEEGRGREEISACTEAGPARNAVDAALWDLESQRTRKSVWALTGTPPRQSLDTDITISMDDPEKMAAQAQRRFSEGFGTLKLKLDASLVLDRVGAVRAAAPSAVLLIDVNEGWSSDHLREFAPRLAALGVAMIEQPLPRGNDDFLFDYRSPVPIFVDEGFQTSGSIDSAAAKYDGVNIKLDKCGGLTEALRIVRLARGKGLKLMTGCFGGTSLAMAPAYVVASLSDFRDIDGPALLLEDRLPGFVYRAGRIAQPEPAFWGTPRDAKLRLGRPHRE